MSKTDVVFDLITAGLRAEELRQKTVANNIANLETPGYRRVDVRFEELVAKAMEAGDEAQVGELEPQVYQPMITRVASNGNDVSLEHEVGQMVQNTLRHSALVKLLNKRLQQMALAIQVQ